MEQREEEVEAAKGKKVLGGKAADYGLTHNTGVRILDNMLASIGFGDTVAE